MTDHATASSKPASTFAETARKYALFVLLAVTYQGVRSKRQPRTAVRNS